MSGRPHSLLLLPSPLCLPRGRHLSLPPQCIQHTTTTTTTTTVTVIATTVTTTLAHPQHHTHRLPSSILNCGYNFNIEVGGRRGC
jgi:hypothetical protein